jgi:tetratricopeptide (TPR) repeat protein
VEGETSEAAASAATRGADSTGIALALGSASREKADSYLDEEIAVSRAQVEILRLQAKIQHEEHALNLSHLRFRRFGDLSKALFEIAAVLVALVVALGLGAMIWNASRSSGLVVEAFSVPSSLAGRGLTGEVVASKLLDRIAAMQAGTQSQRAPESYASYWGNDFKVDIPETGISLGELEKYLREKLGHPTHLTGEVVQEQDRVAITARVADGGSATVSGPAGQFDGLVQQLAERVYGLTQPYRYGVWLQERGRIGDAQNTFAAIASSGPPSERAWGYLGLSNSALETEGVRARLAVVERAAALAPDMFIPRQNMGLSENELSQPEQAIRDLTIAIRLGEAPGHGGSRAEVIPSLSAWLAASIAVNRGDYPGAINAFARVGSDVLVNSTQEFEDYIRALAGAHQIAAARAVLRESARWHIGIVFGDVTAARRIFTGLFIDAQAGDWTTLLKDSRVLATLAPGHAVTALAEMRAVPLIAEAEARLGRFHDADRLISGTPADCYICLIARGTIRSLEHRSGAAEWWMARAASAQPSIPFAYLDWGRNRLERGDGDGAIAKFRDANARSPHFADPLKVWGEALMQKNHSDLALAKFGEANKYAPNWGRLHLEWGKALWYPGKKDEASKQFAMASTLDLSTSDRAAVENWTKPHG